MVANTCRNRTPPERMSWQTESSCIVVLERRLKQYPISR